jgi:hypothetical protein
VVVPVLLAVGALGVLGVVTLVSRAAAPRPALSGKQLSAIASAPRVSVAEAATVREPRRGKPTEPDPQAAITIHAQTTVAGEVWRIVSYRATSGALCAGVTWPGEGQEMGCATEEEWFARGPVALSVAARQAHGHPGNWQNIVLSGFVDLSRVEKVELVSTDCSKREIRVDPAGFFIDVTTPGSIARGIWPYQLLGEDESGQVVQRTGVEQEPPDTAEARAAGVQAPAAGAACA